MKIVHTLYLNNQQVKPFLEIVVELGNSLKSTRNMFRSFFFHFLGSRIRTERGEVLMDKWWWKIRYSVKGVIFPLICIQFVRTLLLPTGLDVFILFGLFLIYLGFLLEVY